MAQEEKERLLRDLCARLPYGVKIELMPVTKGMCVTLTPIILRDYFISDDVNYLPYLRPMSSMTENEKKEFYALYNKTPKLKNGWRDARYLEGLHIDWLNAHHFDYRDLIDKGFAIEVTEENNPYKE